MNNFDDVQKTRISVPYRTSVPYHKGEGMLLSNAEVPNEPNVYPTLTIRLKHLIVIELQLFIYDTIRYDRRV